MPRRAINAITPRILGISTAILLFAGCNTLQTSSEPVERPDGTKGTVGSSGKVTPGKRSHVGLYYFLPKALIEITGKQDVVLNEKNEPIATVPFTITTKRLIVADRKKRYFVRWTQNALYDDTLTELVVDDSGLLTSVKFDTTDQTPAIVKDLVDTTVNVFRIMGGGGPAALAKSTDAPVEPPDELKPFTYTFDPLDSAEVEAVRARLLKYNHLELLIASNRSVRGPIGEALKDHQSAFNPPDAGTTDSPGNGGVFYRPPTTVEIRMHYLNYKEYRVVQRTAISVPDPNSLASFRFGRSPLVKRSTQLTLVAGMPSKAFVDRPSPAKAFTGLLKDVSGTIADAVPTIVNVKDNRTRAELANQKSLLDAQTAGLTSQKNLNDAQAAEIASRPKVLSNKSAGTPVVGGSPTAKSDMAAHTELIDQDRTAGGLKKSRAIRDSMVEKADAEARAAKSSAALQEAQDEAAIKKLKEAKP